MMHISNLTLERLLDHAAELGSRRAVGKRSIPPRAYAADALGRVTSFGFPMPGDDEGRQALAALLQAEMRKREAVMSVLALQATVAVGEGEVDCLVLEGQQLRPARRSEVRLLRIERAGRGGAIADLLPITLAEPRPQERATARHG